MGALRRNGRTTRRCCATRGCASPGRAGSSSRSCTTSGGPPRRHADLRARRGDGQPHLARHRLSHHEALEESGAIQRHAFGGGPARFEGARGGHHDHLIDVDTGEVIEFASARIEALQEEIADPARLRDRPPPPRALRPQDQGGRLTSGPPASSAAEKPRSENGSRTLTPSTSVRVALPPRSRLSAARSRASSGSGGLAAGGAAGAPGDRPLRLVADREHDPVRQEERQRRADRQGRRGAGRQREPQHLAAVRRPRPST